jgi:hypothetical protein
MKNQLGRIIASALLLSSASAVCFAQSKGGSTGATGSNGTATQSAQPSGNAPAPNPNSNPNPNPNSSPIVNPNADDSTTTTSTGAPAPNPNSNPNPNPTSSPIVNPNSNPASTPIVNPPANSMTNRNTTPATTPSGVPITTPTNGVTGPQSAKPQSAASMNSIQLNAAGTTATTPQIFATLDPNHKGYLSTADVASNKFLADNFTRCDTNADGRLSQSEVTVCMSGH